MLIEYLLLVLLAKSKLECMATIDLMFLLVQMKCNRTEASCRRREQSYITQASMHAFQM